MLVRQLHRPLLRSVAAAWRPATTSPVPFHHSDSRSNSSSSTNSNNNSNDDDDQQQHGASSSSSPVAPPTQTPKPSLFEELFPDEAKKYRAAKIKSALDADDDTPRNTWVSQLFVDENEPPRFAVTEELLMRRDEEGDDVPAQQQETSELYSPALRAKGMLILGAASKSLVESDFLRLGMKGKHVEGWVGGIIKVIQARNPDTLEPKGHYFVLFDTHEAAVAYKDRLEQLWGLGKAYVPGAHHGRRHAAMMQQPLPIGLRRTEAGEDVASLVRSFTLVPPSQRLHVQLSRASPARIAELYLEGGFVDRLAARAGSEFLVLLRLDGGRLTLDTLRRAIEDDGLRRNLAWRVTDLDHGILPFGKSIFKTNDQAPGQADSTITSFADEVSSQGLEDEDGDYNGGASGNVSGKSTVNAIYEAKGGNEMHKQYPRFIVPFMDKAEAYRFVQNWHRRELRLRMGGGGKDQHSSEQSRIINATVLW
ncbi:hypothetical protein F4782DRAFT_390429 [Xylaria castorea]|nr:hypothetical protein F4782DRAFT_390429 [Xylaria castorea]